MKYQQTMPARSVSAGIDRKSKTTAPAAGEGISSAARRWLAVTASCALMAGAFMPTMASAKTVEFDLETATLEEMQQAMDAGAFSSVELVSLYLRRIALYDQTGAPFLNSVMFLNPDIMAEAKKSDKLRAEGKKLGPLHGIPCFVKGSYSVKGLPTSGGTTAWVNLIAPEDSFLVKSLRDKGALILGQANMDTWANSGQSSTSQLKGAVKNAYVLGSTAGGSSGGSAVAAAANFAFFTFGGETGASIKGPADRNGLAAQRPTAGAITSNHIINLSAERDVVGPMARNVGDIAKIRDAVSVEDPADPWAPILPLWKDGKAYPKDFNASIATATLAGKKLGIVSTYVGITNPNPGEGATTNTTSVMTTRPEIFANMEKSKAEMEAAGATVSYVFLPPQASTTYDRGVGAPQRVLSTAPTSTRFNAGAHKGMVEFLVKTPGDTLETLAAKVTATAALPTNNGGNRTINDEVISYMYTYGPNGEVTGTNSLNFASAEATEHYTALRDIRRNLEAWMDAEGLDALVFPVDSGKTATVGSVNGRDPINAMHIPGTVVPNGSLPDGEPTCLIFVGRGFDDVEVFKLAYAFEQVSKDRYSTPLAPALPEESFTYTIKDTPPPSGSEPIVTITGKPTFTGSGSNLKVVIKGKVVTSASLASATVYVNGKRVPATFTLASNKKDWTATLPVANVISAIGVSKTISVTVEAKDTKGNTAVKLEDVKFKLSDIL